MDQKQIDQGAVIARDALAFVTFVRGDVTYKQVQDAMQVIFGPEVCDRLREWLLPPHDDGE